jgi:hypothetical protein
MQQSDFNNQKFADPKSPARPQAVWRQPPRLSSEGEAQRPNCVPHSAHIRRQ